MASTSNPSLGKVLARISNDKVTADEVSHYATSTPSDKQALRVSLSWHQQKAQSERQQELRKADIWMAFHEGLRNRGPDSQAYQQLVSMIPGYDSTTRKMKTIRDNARNVKVGVQDSRKNGRISLADMQHPWLRTRESQSGTYNRGLLSIFNAMEEHSKDWSYASLAVCYAILEKMTIASRWEGPAGSHFEAADLSMSFFDWPSVISAVEGNFAKKAKNRPVAERSAYHQFFRVVRIPGGSSIVLSYCKDDMDIGRVPNNLDMVSLAEIGSWQGKKSAVTHPLPPSPPPAPDLPGFVESEQMQIDNDNDNGAQSRESSSSPASTPPPTSPPPPTSSARSSSTLVRTSWFRGLFGF